LSTSVIIGFRERLFRPAMNEALRPMLSPPLPNPLSVFEGASFSYALCRFRGRWIYVID